VIVKPDNWNVSSRLVAPEYKDLWRDAHVIVPMLGAQSPYNLVNNERPVEASFGTYPKRVTTPYGAGWDFWPGGGAFQYTPLLTNDGAGQGDFSLAVLCKPVAESARETALGQWGANSQPQMLFAANMQSNATTVSGYFGLTTWGSPNSFDGVHAASMVDGTWHLFSVSRKGTLHSLYRDGILVATRTVTARNIFYNSTTTHLQLGRYATGALGFRGQIAMAMAANRAWSSTEHALLAQDPFGPFRMADDYPAWMPVPVSSIPFPPLFHRDVESRTRLRM